MTTYITPVRCRFYLVRHVISATPLKHVDSGNLIIDRPTRWGIFLKSVFCFAFRVCPLQYGFIRLPDIQVRQLMDGEKYGVLYPNKVLINGDTYYIEQFTIFSLCVFCLEGIRYGTFWNIFQWRL